eukprot:m.76338 g.76338  ORF g.76338 m.76338 type:complete len:356 (+) comp14631_c0_seq1:122-1189(+)
MVSFAVAVVVAAVVALAAAPVQVQAWGPVAHAVFNCLALYPDLDVADCVAGNSPLPAYGVLAASSDLPDAFGFGAFNVGTQPDGLCLNLTYVHDPVFGGNMITKVAGSRAFDPTKPLDPKEAMARGFLGHIVGDLVGFHPGGGILCTAQAGGCTRDTVLYMPLWGYMAALDAALWVQYGLTGLAVVGADMASFGAFDFLASSSQTQGGGFAPFSSAEAETCATFWSNNAAYVAHRATYISSSELAYDALSEELAWFLPNQTAAATHAATRRHPVSKRHNAGNNNNAKTSAKNTNNNTPQQRESRGWEPWLAAQTKCAVAAIQLMTSTLVHTAPAAAWSAVAAFVQQQYDAGACTA